MNIPDLLVYKIAREVYHWFISVFCASFRIIVNRIRDVVREHVNEKRLGIITPGGADCAADPTLFNDSHVCDATPYGSIERMLARLEFNGNDVFIDLGCGKGRVVCSVAARKKIKKVVGIEARKEIFALASENVNNLKIRMSPIAVVNADVATCDLSAGTIFYMFSPFGIATQTEVLKNIRESLRVNPRQVRIVCYAGPDLGTPEEATWLHWWNGSDDSITVWYTDQVFGYAPARL
jgi:hypothetical protein